MRKTLLLFLLAALPAYAQEAPSDELPSPLPPETTAEPAQEAAPPPPSVPVAHDAITPPPSANIRATSEPAVSRVLLGAQSTAGQGTIEQKSGGLAADVWASSNVSTLTSFLEDAGGGFTRGVITEPSWREVAKRLALTNAMEPEGAGPAFFADRVLLAASAGYVKAARELLARNPSFLSEGGAERLAAIALMQADMGGSCADPHITQQSSGFWQKLAIACSLGADGGGAKAQLALDIMREAGEADELFLEIAEAGASGKKQLNAKTKPENMHVLHAAMLVAGKVPPTPAMLDVLALTPYPLLLALKAPDAWRGKIALQLARGLWISPNTLHELFAAFTVKPDVQKKLRADPKLLGDEKLVPVSLRAAYALRSATGAEAPVKAALLGGLIQLSNPEDLLGSLGATIIASLPPASPALAPYAAPIAKLTLIQNAPMAKDWLALAASAVELYPLAALRGLLPNAEEAMAVYARATNVPLEHRADAMALLQILGVNVGAKAESSLTALDITLPDAARDRDLDDAVGQKRVGEALLRAMLLSPRDAISILLTKVKTLQSLGLDKEATALALPLL
jgi:hypothetical protein